MLQRFREIVSGVALALGCQADIDLQGITPAVINDPQIAARVQSVAEAQFPGDLIQTDFSTMGSEDMAFIMKEIPGCYYFVGSANAEKGLNFAHHHPRFDFDERVLPRAASLMASAAAEFMK